MPTLVSHGGGAGATDNQPTTNITAINLQHAGFYRTGGTDGRLIIDTNGVMGGLDGPIIAGFLKDGLIVYSKSLIK